MKVGGTYCYKETVGVHAKYTNCYMFTVGGIESEAVAVDDMTEEMVTIIKVSQGVKTRYMLDDENESVVIAQAGLMAENDEIYLWDDDFEDLIAPIAIGDLFFEISRVVSSVAGTMSVVLKHLGLPGIDVQMSFGKDKDIVMPGAQTRERRFATASERRERRVNRAAKDGCDGDTNEAAMHGRDEDTNEAAMHGRDEDTDKKE